MSQSGTRLYLGNLNVEINERDIKKRLKAFGTVTDVQIKRRQDHEGNITATFAHVTLSDGDANECVAQLNQQKWNGQSIRAEVAKTSYLERMAAKRSLVQTLEPQDTKPFDPPQSKKLKSDIKEKMQNPLSWNHKTTLVDNQRMKTSNVKLEKRKKSDVEQDGSDNSDCEVFWKKNFASEKEVSFDFAESKGNIKNRKSDDLLSKFESFSSIWDDSPALGSSYNEMGLFPKIKKLKSYEREQNKKTVEMESCPLSSFRTSPNETVTKKNLKANTTTNGSFQSSLQTSINIYPDKTKHKEKQESGNKKISSKQQSEEKRKFAMEERLNAFEQKQAIVKKALAGQPLNKIIKFEDEDDKTASRSSTTQLFEDDSHDEDDQSNNFSVKKQFEGRKGEKLLELQSRFTNDKRFRLDERFAESDSEQEGMGEEQDDEIQKQLSILSSIVGTEEMQKVKIKVQDRGIKSIVRFDPNNPEHGEKYKISSEPVKKKKKRRDDDDNDIEVITSNETPMPEVPPERFFEVSESLKQVLAPTSNNTFSLRALFKQQDSSDTNDDEESPNKTVAETQLVTHRKLVKNPLLQDNTTDEEENDSTLPTSECGVGWLDNTEFFFFKTNDSRLQEGTAFFKAVTVESQTQFVKQRKELLSEVKKKLRSVNKKKLSFKHKLGGRSTKSRKRKTNMN